MKLETGAVTGVPIGLPADRGAAGAFAACVFPRLTEGRDLAAAVQRILWRAGGGKASASDARGRDVTLERGAAPEDGYRLSFAVPESGARVTALIDVYGRVEPFLREGDTARLIDEEGLVEEALRLFEAP